MLNCSSHGMRFAPHRLGACYPLPENQPLTNSQKTPEATASAQNYLQTKALNRSADVCYLLCKSNQNDELQCQ